MNYQEFKELCDKIREYDDYLEYKAYFEFFNEGEIGNGNDSRYLQSTF